MKEKSKKNRVNGYIATIDDPDTHLYEFSGVASDVVHYYKPKSKKKRVLLDFVSLEENDIYHPDVRFVLIFLNDRLTYFQNLHLTMYGGM